MKIKFFFVNFSKKNKIDIDKRFKYIQTLNNIFYCKTTQIKYPNVKKNWQQNWRH